MKRLIIPLLLVFSWMLPVFASSGALCTDAKIFTKIIDQLCWSCVLPIRLAGVGGTPPPGAATSNSPVCFCMDNNGVPKPPGLPASFWSPRRLIETVKVPYCSPSLGGMRLQNSLVGMGTRGGNKSLKSSQQKSFYQYHYFAYPIMEMLSIFVMPDCTRDQYSDFDLMYLSEIDPLHNNDLLAFIMNPESAIFANPLALVSASVDCAAITAGQPSENLFFSAGCDGLMYPLTGNIGAGGQPARNTSLIAQRAIASLHRKGLVKRSMGDDALCEPKYSPMIPKSMYKLSAIFPIPEADGNKSVQAPKRDADGNPEKNSDGTIKMQSIKVGCCHNLGDSVSKWRGLSGETIPGIGEDYVYLLFKYTDCCLSSGPG
jgi:conjugal transfer pilus assembly protein TraU